MTLRSTAGRHGSVGADRARELADPDALDHTLQTMQVAVGLEGEACEAQAEGGRLGMDSVGAAHGQGLAVLESPLDQGVAILPRPRSEQLSRLGELDGERRVEDVGGGQPVVDPPPLGADRSGDDVHERGQVVAGRALALIDGLDGELRPLPARRGRVGRHSSLGRPGIQRRELDRQPGLHPPAGGPHRAHLRAGVALDHAGLPASAPARSLPCAAHQVAMIRAASSPAFLEPSMATQPTGTPGGI